MSAQRIHKIYTHYVCNIFPPSRLSNKDNYRIRILHKESTLSVVCPMDDDTTKAQSTSSRTEVEPGEQELDLRGDPCPAPEMLTCYVHDIQISSPRKQKRIKQEDANPPEMLILRLRKDKEFTSFLSYVLQLHLHVHKDDVVALRDDWRQE